MEFRGLSRGKYTGLKALWWTSPIGDRLANCFGDSKYDLDDTFVDWSAAAGWLVYILVNFGVKEQEALGLGGELLLFDLVGVGAEAGGEDSVSFQNLSWEESADRSVEKSVLWKLVSPSSEYSLLEKKNKKLICFISVYIYTSKIRLKGIINYTSLALSSSV